VLISLRQEAFKNVPRGNMVYLNPKVIVTDFLRNNLTDPRSRAESSNSNTITSGGQTEFSITPSSGTTVSCITSVTVEGTTQDKWHDYYIDFQNQKVIFFNTVTNGDEVVINFKEGSTNWIYPDKPHTNLSINSFPRISITLVSGTGTRLGTYKAPIQTELQFSINIYTKEKGTDQIYTINGIKYYGNSLAEYISWQVMKAFEDNESEMFPALYDYTIPQPPLDLDFTTDSQTYRKQLNVNLKGVSVGEI